MQETENLDLKSRMCQFELGPYRIEVAHRSSESPECGVGEAYFPGGTHIYLESNKLDISSESKDIGVLHLNAKTLAEKEFNDFLREHNFALVPHTPDAVGGLVEDILQTISEIAPRFGYFPITYLSQTLGIDPISYLENFDAEKYGEQASQLALLKVLGYYQVSKNIDPLSEDIELGEKQEVQKDRPRLTQLAHAITKDQNKIGKNLEEITRTFEQVSEAKRRTYDCKKEKDAIERLKKPEEERYGLSRTDFEFPLEVIGCVLYDKFGQEFVEKFFDKYFLMDIADEKTLAQDITRGISIGKSETEKAVKDAKEITENYMTAQIDLEKEVTKSIIQSNLKDLRLFIGGLHFYEDTMIIDDTNTLPTLSQFQIIDEKKDGNRKKRHYLFQGKEVEQDSLSTEEKLMIDGLETLRRKGDRREMGFFSVGENEFGLKIDFNKIALIKNGVIPKDWLTERELEVLDKFEEVLESEFDYDYKEDPDDYYSVYVGQRKIGEFPVPKDVTPSELKRTTLVDLMREDEDIPLCVIDKFYPLITAEEPTESKLEELRTRLYEENLSGEQISTLVDFANKFYDSAEDIERAKTERITPATILREEYEKKVERNSRMRDAWTQIYSQMPEEFRLSHDETAGIMTGEITEKAHRASINRAIFKKEKKKRYRIRRRTKNQQSPENQGSESDNYEDIGTIKIATPIESLLERKLRDLTVMGKEEKEDLIELTKAQFKGIDYMAENGDVWILRKARLDELAEDFYQALGKAGEHLDLKFIRVTHKGNLEFFERLLEAYLTEEKETGDRRINAQEKKELMKQRKEKDVYLTNDDIRRMLLEAKAMGHRGIFDTVQSKIAEYAADKKLELHEAFLTNELFMPVLYAENVPEDLIGFLNERKGHAITKVEEETPEQRELLHLIRETIIKENKPQTGDPQYERLLQMVGMMVVPPEQRETEFSKMREHYSTKFLLNLNQLIDELPELGKDVFTDSFYAHFGTRKRRLTDRITKLLDDESIIDQVRMGFDYIVGPFDMNENTFKRYARAMAKLPEKVRKQLVENMNTWTDKLAIDGQILRYLNNELLDEDTLKKVRQAEIVEKVTEGEEAVDDAFGEAFGNIETAETSIEPELWEEFTEARKRIQKEQGITDEDLDAVFNSEDDFF